MSLISNKLIPVFTLFSDLFATQTESYCWWFRNSAPVEVGSWNPTNNIYHVFLHPRRFFEPSTVWYINPIFLKKVHPNLGHPSGVPTNLHISSCLEQCEFSTSLSSCLSSRTIFVEIYPGKLTWLAGKTAINESMYLLLKIVIVQCHISFQGGYLPRQFQWNAEMFGNSTVPSLFSKIQQYQPTLQELIRNKIFHEYFSHGIPGYHLQVPNSRSKLWKLKLRKGDNSINGFENEGIKSLYIYQTLWL